MVGRRGPDGKRGLWLPVLVIFVFVGVFEVAIAWATYDDCGKGDRNKIWTVAPPGWTCNRSTGVELWPDGPSWSGF